MSGGRHRYRVAVVQETRKGVLLSADERLTVIRMRRMRFNAIAIAKAVGRSVPDIEEFLRSPEAQHG